MTFQDEMNAPASDEMMRRLRNLVMHRQLPIEARRAIVEARVAEPMTVIEATVFEQMLLENPALPMELVAERIDA